MKSFLAITFFLFLFIQGFITYFKGENDTIGARVARVPVDKFHEPIKVALPAEASRVGPSVQSVEVLLDVSVRDLPPQAFFTSREFV